MGDIFKIALCQGRVLPDKEQNLSKTADMVKEAAAGGSGIVILPEMFNCPYDSSFFPHYAEEYPAGETLSLLARLAAENSIYLVGGSLPEKEGPKIYNSSFVYGPDGNLLARHRKLHLFDVDIADGISFKESETLSPGSEITVFNTAYCPVGLAICYDLRFPELARLMALQGAKIIIIPGAFNMTTGPAHWEALFKVRALDNQVFMVGVSPARDEEAGYVAFGHSMVVGPWGDVIAKAGAGEEIIYADIDLAGLEKVRQELPLLRHRRNDIYQLKG